MTTFTVTYDIHDGARRISRRERETIDQLIADDATKTFFDELGKSKYGDKFVRISKIERANDNSTAVVVFQTTEDDV